MNQQTNQAMTQALTANWAQTSHAILDRFTTVCKADIDAAYDADDLVTRISSITSYDPSYVQEKVGELVGVGAPQAQSSQQFGQQLQQPIQPQFAQQQGQQQFQQGQQSHRSNRGGRGRGNKQWSGQQQRSLGSYS